MKSFLRVNRISRPCESATAIFVTADTSMSSTFQCQCDEFVGRLSFTLLLAAVQCSVRLLSDLGSSLELNANAIRVSCAA